MSVKASKGKLEKSTKNLLVAWDETKESWRDAKAHEFEKHYIADLTDTVIAASRAMGKIDDLLAKLKKDCE